MSIDLNDYTGGPEPPKKSQPIYANGADITIQEMAQALGKARRVGCEWICLCPTHGDHEPSLWITEGENGKPLVNCRAGCTQGAVIGELKRRGLWPRGETVRPETQRIVATYNYCNPDTSLRYQTVRYGPKKTFKQRRPNGSPESYIWNIDGVEPLPYRLPELLANPDATIFIVEGEKDVDNLCGRLGLIATCNHGGAMKWRPEISRWLAGRHVVILPDNDSPGQKHAQDVAQKLSGIAASIRIAGLPGAPPKGDVSDWIAAGGTRESLEKIAKYAPLFDPGVDPAIEEARDERAIFDAGEDDPIEPRQWLLGGEFCRKFISALFGDGGVGKTALRLLQYVSLAIGRSLTGEYVHHRARVLLVCLEDDLDEVRRRIRAIRLYHKVSADELRGWLYVISPSGLKLLRETENGEFVSGKLDILVRDLIDEYKIDLVAFDPFVKSHGVNENDNNAIDQVCITLSSIAADMNCAIDVIHHTRKGLFDPGNADMGRGASALKDGARLVKTIAKMSTDEAKIFGIPESDRAKYVRVDNGKINLAPPAASARWFQLIGVPLHNGNDLYPHGDEIQTVEPWQPPSAWDDATHAVLNQILDAIDSGMPNGSRYSDHNAARERAAWKVVQQYMPTKSDAQCKEIIKTWVKNGVLFTAEYTDPERREQALGLCVNLSKRPS